MKFKVKNKFITRFVYAGEVFEVKNGIVDIPDKYTKYFLQEFGDILIKVGDKEIPIPPPPTKKETK